MVQVGIGEYLGFMGKVYKCRNIRCYLCFVIVDDNFFFVVIVDNGRIFCMVVSFFGIFGNWSCYDSGDLYSVYGFD